MANEIMKNQLISKNLIGRPYWQAPILAARVEAKNCIAHHLVAIKAIESACNIKVSTQTVNLRKLLLAAEFIKNHTLYLYEAILPTFLDLETVSELAKMHPEIYHCALALTQFTDQILISIGGRVFYPITSVVSGFKSHPNKSELKQFVASNENLATFADQTLRLFAGLKLQAEKSKTDFVALHQNDEYAFYDGEIWTSAGEIITRDKFEKLVKYSNKKTFGALARYNLSQSHLDAHTKKLLSELKVEKNLSGQSGEMLAAATELNYFITLSMNLLEKLARDGVKPEHILPPQKFSTGSAVIESAGGAIIHSCELDKNGIILKYEIDMLNYS